MKFSIGDIIERKHENEFLLRVSGVIHDDERLFVCDDTDRLNDGKEFEIPFNEITAQYSLLKSKASRTNINELNSLFERLNIQRILNSNSQNTYVMSCHLTQEDLYKRMKADIRTLCFYIEYVQNKKRK